ncbi:MAG TPA: hypothetical protein VEK80_15060, partial [Kribbellaceae bacterium]|nr:hypothetical protein [Kribbellaceae bacterium]
MLLLNTVLLMDIAFPAIRRFYPRQGFPRRIRAAHWPSSSPASRFYSLLLAALRSAVDLDQASSVGRLAACAT